MNQQALQDQMRLCAIKSCEKCSCHMLVVQLWTKQTGRGKCGRISPAWSLRCTSLKLGLVATVTSIKICQNNSPLLWWMLIQSRTVSVTVCCFGPRRFIRPFQCSIPACGWQSSHGERTTVPLSRFPCTRRGSNARLSTEPHESHMSSSGSYHRRGDRNQIRGAHSDLFASQLCASGCGALDFRLQITACSPAESTRSIIRTLNTYTKGLRRGRRQEVRKEGVYGSVCF